MAISGLSNDLETKLLDHVFGGTTYSQPASVLCALFTTDPDETGAGTEVTGGSYARQTCSFAAASGNSKTTNADLTFTSMPACTVTHVGLYDNSGNFLAGGALSASKVVGAGDTFTIASGNLTITID